MRSTKNAIICFITLLCRASIEQGVDSEFAFALSDFYINKLEMQTDEQGLKHLINTVLEHYHDLVQQHRISYFSKPMVKAIRYINRNIYDKCTVKDVADHVGVHPTYLAKLFHDEADISPSEYIQKKKMEEANQLLKNNDYKISEIADILGYCDTPHFSKTYKNFYGVSPRRSNTII